MTWIQQTTTAVLSGVLAGCAPSEGAKPDPPPAKTRPAPTSQQAATKPAGESFEAVVRVDAEPGGKKFQGVWLERDDGEKWVISYRPERYWKAFEGRRVVVAGDRYQPRGQAIGAQHFRVETMKLADEKEFTDDLVEVGPEVEIDGKFGTFEFPPGTKLAGEEWTVFVGGGTQYHISHFPDPMPELRKPVRVRARAVVPSPYVARPGGPYLWIIEVLR